MHFKVWDVDDPFEQVNAAMPGVTQIDDDLTGGDNRGPEALALPWVQSGQLGANGEARATFTVSTQPGNNYRAGASCRPGALNQPPAGQTMQDVADAINNRNPVAPGDWSGYSVPLTWSPMLTVWRKLHVEVDSMDAESLDQRGSRESQEEWTRFVVAQPSPTIPMPIQPGVPDLGLTTVLGFRIPYGSPCEGDFENRWEGGAFTPQVSGLTFLIVRNSCHATSDGQVLTKFIIFGDPGSIAGTTIDIRDDDLFVTGGAPRQLPQLSVLTPDIAAAYGQAYIHIVEASSTLNTDAIVPWTSNLSSWDLSTSYALGNLTSGVGGHRDLDTASDFWVRRVLVCYQPGEGEDMDADPYENGAISQNVAAGVLAPYPVQQLSFLGDTAENKTMGATVRGVTIGTALSTVYKETALPQNPWVQNAPLKPRGARPQAACVPPYRPSPAR